MFFLTRTLRYYDEIGLLKPSFINSPGYRIYQEAEVDLLQQILFYRSMDMKLKDIQKLMSQPDFNIPKALIKHHEQLIIKRNELDQLILTVENKMFESLKEVVKTKDLESKTAKNVYENHKVWLNFTCPSYSLEAHIGLAEMYVEDERFAKYYNDRAGIDAARVLRDIIIKYTI